MVKQQNKIAGAPYIIPELSYVYEIDSEGEALEMVKDCGKKVVETGREQLSTSKRSTKIYYFQNDGLTVGYYSTLAKVLYIYDKPKKWENTY